MLEIRDLHATVDGKAILRGLNLTVKKGEIHAIMGPNGAGKSTLAKILGGHPSYDVSEGDVLIEGQSIIGMAPEERAALGLFMSFQYPIEIPGVTNTQFLHAAHTALQKARGSAVMSLEQFERLLDEKMQMMEIRAEFKSRNVNEGFSGGEKKRNEILQMAIIDPKIAILDETDSGLDIDALRIVAHSVTRLMNANNGLILITHYQRLLEYIQPTYVHVMIEGKIVCSGGPELALKLEEKGYDWLINKDCLP